MTMLIEELQMLSADWRSWVVVAFMAMIAGASVVARLVCVHANGTHTPTDDEMRSAQEASFRPGWRFGLMMALGICLTLIGLFMIAAGIRPTLALAALVLGIVIIQTEPARLQIRENERVVIASRDAGALVLEGARDRLRSSHHSLVTMNFVLLAGLILALIAF